MSKVDELVINYAIYEDAVEYLGTTEVTLPDLEYMTEELSGAGIAGNIEESLFQMNFPAQIVQPRDSNFFSLNPFHDTNLLIFHHYLLIY